MGARAGCCVDDVFMRPGCFSGSRIVFGSRGTCIGDELFTTFRAYDHVHNYDNSSDKPDITYTACHAAYAAITTEAAAVAATAAA